MTDKIDGKECRYWFRPNPSDYRRCALRGKDDNCDEINDCFIKELLGKLAQKDEECKRLKEEIKTNGFGCFNIEMSEQLDQFKQTLAEIKPILELYANSKIGEEQLDGTYKITVKNSSILGDTYITFDPRPAKQALQKIKEYKVKSKELLEISINTADKYGIQDKYMVEYITSSCVMSREDALDLYEHANMKCCDTVRLYKVNSAEDIELVKEKS